MAGWFLMTFRVMQALAVLAGLFQSAMNVLMLIGVRSLTSFGQFFGIMMRVYGVIFGLIIVVGEFEGRFSTLIQYIRFMRPWPGRALFHVFVAIMLLSNVRTFSCTGMCVDLLSAIAGWLLLGVGALYFVLGLLCGRQKKMEEEAKAEVADKTNVKLKKARSEV